MQNKAETENDVSEKIYAIDEVVELLKESWNGKKWEFEVKKEEIMKDE